MSETVAARFEPGPTNDTAADDAALIEAVAAAIYGTHRSAPEWSEGQRPAPTWSNASDAVRQWVRAQAERAIAVVRAADR